MASSSTNPLKRGRSGSGSDPTGVDLEPPTKKGKGKATETAAEEAESSECQGGPQSSRSRPSTGSSKFKWENVRFGSIQAIWFDRRYENGKPRQDLKTPVSAKDKQALKCRHPVLVLEAPATGSDSDQIVQFLPLSHGFPGQSEKFRSSLEYGIKGRGTNSKSTIYIEPKTTSFGNIRLYAMNGNDGLRISEPGFEKLMVDMKEIGQVSEADTHTGIIAGPSRLSRHGEPF